ncbi:MAG TPA: hypothetical protein VLK84_08605, partial [Longimicrobium sp.]|nr:hypothetical protein [Longimicrobium sp.]
METNKQATGAGLPGRRALGLLLGAALAGSVMAVGPLAWAASPDPLDATPVRMDDVSPSAQGKRTVVRNVRFYNDGIEMAGDLYLP